MRIKFFKLPHPYNAIIDNVLGVHFLSGHSVYAIHYDRSTVLQTGSGTKINKAEENWKTENETGNSTVKRTEIKRNLN